MGNYLKNDILVTSTKKGQALAPFFKAKKSKIDRHDSEAVIASWGL
jgi:hypothetical protein